MGWDNSRPVPWQRLMREWVVYALIMSAVFIVFFRNSNVVGAIAGVLISGPLYVGFGAVMAKFGYTRKRLKDLRAEAKVSSDDSSSSGSTSGSTSGSSSSDASGTGTRPAPTSRTSTGSNRPRSASKRKR